MNREEFEELMIQEAKAAHSRMKMLTFTAIWSVIVIISVSVWFAL